MDEQNNGPVPGIIGQDVPSEPAAATPAVPESQDSGKLFDSSEYTGIKPQESLSFSANGEEKTDVAAKPKGSNPFTKWQLWAIFSGVILVASAVVIFIIIGIYDGKLASANAAARYDSLATSTETLKKEFEEKLFAYTKTVYSYQADNSSLTISPVSDYNTDPNKNLYPTNDEIYTAGGECLKQDMYGLSDDDISYATTHKTASELLGEGKNVAEEAERLEKINNAYRSASNTIDTCHDPILSIKLKDFDITLSDAEYTKNPDDSESTDVRRNIKITYKGSNEIEDLVLVYGMLDKNGLVTEFQFVRHNEDVIKNGNTVESRTCGNLTYIIGQGYLPTNSCVYTVKTKDLDKNKVLKPKLMAIYGKYPSQFKY